MCVSTVVASDRPKFGSAPVPAEIMTRTETPVSVPASLEISVPAEISVQKCTKICRTFFIFDLTHCIFFDTNILKYLNTIKVIVILQLITEKKYFK